MITDNYIKMCEQAEEIQKGHKWRKYDVYIVKNCLQDVSYYDETAYNLEAAGMGIKELVTSFIWLPTLEQLFEIWSYLCNTNNKAHPNYLAGDHLPTQFFYRIHKELTRTNIGIWFDKAVCLEIIMRDFFNKIWTDGKWEVIK